MLYQLSYLSGNRSMYLCEDSEKATLCQPPLRPIGKIRAEGASDARRR